MVVEVVVVVVVCVVRAYLGCVLCCVVRERPFSSYLVVPGVGDISKFQKHRETFSRRATGSKQRLIILHPSHPLIDNTTAQPNRITSRKVNDESTHVFKHAHLIQQIQKHNRK